VDAVMAQRPCADEREQQFVAVLSDFLDARDRGWPVSAECLIAINPEIAPDLREFLRVYEWLERLTAPLRARRDAKRWPFRTRAAAIAGSTF
jgi:hypothetical protein